MKLMLCKSITKLFACPIAVLKKSPSAAIAGATECILRVTLLTPFCYFDSCSCSILLRCALGIVKCFMELSVEIKMHFKDHTGFVFTV